MFQPKKTTERRVEKVDRGHVNSNVDMSKMHWHYSFIINNTYLHVKCGYTEILATQLLYMLYNVFFFLTAFNQDCTLHTFETYSRLRYSTGCLYKNQEAQWTNKLILEVYFGLLGEWIE